MQVLLKGLLLPKVIFASSPNSSTFNAKNVIISRKLIDLVASKKVNPLPVGSLTR